MYNIIGPTVIQYSIVYSSIIASTVSHCIALHTLTKKYYFSTVEHLLYCTTTVLASKVNSTVHIVLLDIRLGTVDW
jgi:hypothetical protein